MKNGRKIKTFNKKQTSDLLVAGLFVVIFLLVFSLAFAQVEELKKTAQTAGLPQEMNIPILVGRVIRIFLGFAGLILVVLIIYGGTLWLTSGGEEEKIKKAKALILNAVIGLAIIVVSYAITVFVLEALFWVSGKGGGNIEP